MQFKFAMLEILAERPDGRATLDELSREMETAADDQETADRFLELDGVDVFQTGLVVSEDDALRITDAGRSVLRALKKLSAPETESNADRSQSLQLIDALIGAKQRLKIFDLRLRANGGDPNLEPPEEEQDVEREAIQAGAEAGLDDEVEPIAPQLAGETADVHDLGRISEIDVPVFSPLTAPTFLKRDFGSRVQTPTRTASRRSNLPASIASGLARVGGILRGHLERDVPNIRKEGRAAAVGGVVLAVLSLLVIVTGAGALIAVNQIKSLKTEIATLERELAPIKKQAGRPEPVVENKKETDQKDLQGRAGADKATSSGQSRAAPAALNLSPEEIRLVKDYIKPAPLAGPATLPSINVGDPVTSGTIPLPSPLTDRIPKLLGARFTIRNGAIVIVRRESRQADAVLPPN